MDWELSSRHLLCGFVPVMAILDVDQIMEIVEQSYRLQADE